MPSIREFTDADYPRLTEIANLIYSDVPFSERELRYMDETWDRARYFHHRIMREDDAGLVVGYGEARHMPDQFHPDKYSLEIMVDPAFRRRGHGAAIYDALATTLADRGAIAARVWARESEPDSHQFLAHRGFTEARREWQSRRDVATFDAAPFASAWDRVAGHGIVITDLVAEQGVNADALTDVYQLDLICSRDVPDIDPHTEVSYEEFLKNVIHAPYSIPEAFLIAKHGHRYVGLARMFGSEEEPDVLYQGLTGVIPEYRGKGVAMALKLKTVERAGELGKRQIRTWNDTTNRAMLRINEAMGFQKEPAEVVYLKDFTAASTPDQQPARAMTHAAGSSA